MSSGRTDDDLLAAWGRGDGTVGEALFERYFDPIYRFFYSRTEEPEELTQMTFAACLEARYRGEGSFRGFLFAIARRQLHMHLRKRYAARVIDLSSMSLAALGPSPVSLIAASDRNAQLLEALRELPADLQIAIELYYWEELSTAELAAVLEVPQGTVKRWLFRARQLPGERLRQREDETVDVQARMCGLRGHERQES